MLLAVYLGVVKTTCLYECLFVCVFVCFFLLNKDVSSTIYIMLLRDDHLLASIDAAVSVFLYLLSANHRHAKYH